MAQIVVNSHRYNIAEPYCAGCILSHTEALFLNKSFVRFCSHELFRRKSDVPASAEELERLRKVFHHGAETLKAIEQESARLAEILLTVHLNKEGRKVEGMSEEERKILAAEVLDLDGIVRDAECNVQSVQRTAHRALEKLLAGDALGR